MLFNKDEKQDLKYLFKIVLPLSIQTMMLFLVSASDTFMLGLVSQDSLSSVSLAGNVMLTFSLFMMTVSIGLGMLVSQYYGIKDTDSINKIFSFSLVISIIIGLIFTIVVYIIPEEIIGIFTDIEELKVLGGKYLRIFAINYFLYSFIYVLHGILKSTGFTKDVFIITFISVILNIGLNAVFIFGLFGFKRMEVEGAALASVTSIFLELILSIIVLIKKTKYRINLRNIFVFDKVLFKDFIKYTLPVLGNEIFWGFGFMMQSFIMGHLGNDAVAANSIANVVKDLAASFSYGLGTGAGIVVGNLLGEKNYSKAKEMAKLSVKLSLIIGIVVGFLILALSPLIINLSKLSDTSRNYLLWMLIMCVYYMVGRSFNSCTISGIFPAGGDSKFGFFCDLITMWAFIVPFSLLAAFVFKWPVLVVYFIINLDEIVKLPAVIKNYKAEKWLKNITKQES